MENTKEITAIVLPEKLNEIATTSGLDVNKALEHAFKFVSPMKEINELSKSLSILNKENPSLVDVKTARTNRLALVKVRSRAKEIKEELKENILTEGKLIDKLFNTVIDTAQLSESEYDAIEKHAENLEKERKESLRKERTGSLSGLTENTAMYPLGEMSEEAFNELLSGLKMAKEAAEQAMIKAEEERIAKEKAEAEERERIRLENIKLKAEAEENERLAAIERKKQADALAKIEAERKAEQEKARKEKEVQELKLKKEREENERLANELKDKKEAEEMAIKQAKEKADKDEKERKEAEKKALKAPDKEKLKEWLNSIQCPPMPVCKSSESQDKAVEILARFGGFKKWANELIESI